MAKNTPLTNEQKLQIMTAQRKLMSKQISFQKELHELEAAFTQTLAGVVKANDLDFTEIFLNDDLEVTAIPAKV